MGRGEFANGIAAIAGKKIVIVGCGAQGLNQGLNMRDSGCDISYTLRQSAIDAKRASFVNATSNGFKVGTYEELIPTADLVLNLTPDKQHTSVVNALLPMMKKGATLAYSHGFNIVEEGMQVRDDLTVIMVAPKCPGTEVREEYKRGFGVPTLIAVHPENDPQGHGLDQAKAYAAATGGDRAGVLESSFVAEVKSDLMGEQTILCGMLQTGAVLCFDKMVAKGIDSGYASKLIQYGWETITEALKHGGVTGMMDRLDNPSKIKAFELAQELKVIMQPLYAKHQNDIITGHFSSTMMADWDNDDVNLLKWRAETAETGFEKTAAGSMNIPEQVGVRTCARACACACARACMGVCISSSFLWCASRAGVLRQRRGDGGNGQGRRRACLRGDGRSWLEARVCLSVQPASNLMALAVACPFHICGAAR